MDRVYSLTVAVPAGTAIASPVTVPFPLETNLLADIEILIPSGHAGLTGIRIQRGDVIVLPWGQGSWLIGSDYVRTFPVDENINANALTVAAYNTDIFPHSFYLRARISDAPAAPAALPPVQQADTTLTDTVAIPGPLTPDALLGPDTVAALSVVGPPADVPQTGLVS
jgi:hypothetical protein